MRKEAGAILHLIPFPFLGLGRLLEKPPDLRGTFRAGGTGAATQLQGLGAPLDPNAYASCSCAAPCLLVPFTRYANGSVRPGG